MQGYQQFEPFALYNFSRKNLFLSYSQIIFDKKKIVVRDLAIQVLIKKVEEQTRRLEKLEKENKILCHDNAVLKAENAMFKAEIEELKARLESNSHNSNKPPSSDGYKKETVKPAFPQSKGSKQGGQNGHKGHTLKQVEAPDKIVICTPGACTL